MPGGVERGSGQRVVTGWNPESAEARLIELYQDQDATKWWMMRLRAHDGFKEAA